MQIQNRNSTNFDKIRNDSQENRVSQERENLIKTLAMGSRSEYNSVRGLEARTELD